MFAEEMRHFAHYQQRRVVHMAYDDPNDPWYAENQPDDQGFDKPWYHVTRRRNGPASRIEVGDSLWVFSQLVTPWGKFPPALDFRVDVKAVELRSGGGFRYEAERSSKWYNLFDGSSHIGRLETIDSNGNKRPLLKSKDQHVGHALQSIRQLASDEELRKLASKIDERGFEFISYRLLDGTEPAFRKALERVRAGRAVFWDRWSLPRRLAERREFLSDPALDRHLMRAIDHSVAVWAIQSLKYGEIGSYSKKEYDRARTQGRLKN